MTVLFFIGIYLGAINLLGFIIIGLDKRKARRRTWRISEATLFTCAIFGGSIGCLLGMWIFHHKTQKLLFIIGMPAILALQLLILGILFIFKPVLFSIM